MDLCCNKVSTVVGFNIVLMNMATKPSDDKLMFIVKLMLKKNKKIIFQQLSSADRFCL